MNQNKSFRIMKVSPEFDKIIKKAKIDRIRNNVDDVRRTDVELTEMLLNTPSFKEKSFKELTGIPRKEDLDKFRERLI